MKSPSTLLVLLLPFLCSCFSPVTPPPSTSSTTRTRTVVVLQQSSQTQAQCTELPDSLEDAAARAAEASSEYQKMSGPLSRARVDFDTSVGDETYTKLKSTTEFMQIFVTKLCYSMIPGLQQLKQDEMMKVVSARADLKALFEEEKESEDDADADDDDDAKTAREKRQKELTDIIVNDGRDPEYKYDGPIARIYFPDEGSAALARRDWIGQVPPCVQFSSSGGVQNYDINQDLIIFFFCPNAAESDAVESVLGKTEQSENSKLLLSVFVNPNLVDMGVTGFGMAGRMLRERLIDPLVSTYYLRTLQWGALTRKWPSPYSIWQEDENAPDGTGYRLIKTTDRLPSNPEVEDIYDAENSGSGNDDDDGSGGPGVLDQLGDFVNGMMRL